MVPNGNSVSIFGVTETLFFLSLQELKNLIPKSAVGTLSANSSNVINLIIDAYNVSTVASSRFRTFTCTNLQPLLLVALWELYYGAAKLL